MVSFEEKKVLKSSCLKTRWPRPLIFGMYLQLKGLHQDCLNYGPGIKMASSRRSLVLHKLLWGKALKSSFVKLEALVIWYLVLLCGSLPRMYT